MIFLQPTIHDVFPKLYNGDVYSLVSFYVMYYYNVIYTTVSICKSQNDNKKDYFNPTALWPTANVIVFYIHNN